MRYKAEEVECGFVLRIEDTFLIPFRGIVISGITGSDWDNLRIGDWISIDHEGLVSKFKILEFERFSHPLSTPIPSMTGGIIVPGEDMSVIHSGDLVKLTTP